MLTVRQDLAQYASQIALKPSAAKPWQKPKNQTERVVPKLSAEELETLLSAMEATLRQSFDGDVGPLKDLAARALLLELEQRDWITLPFSPSHPPFRSASFGTMTFEPILSIDLPGFQKLKSGKVREIFDLGDALLLVATDRISAFDCVMPNGIPRKGEVLTQLSHFWFERSASWMPNHLLACATDPLPPKLSPSPRRSRAAA